MHNREISSKKSESLLNVAWYFFILYLKINILSIYDEKDI